MKKLLILVAIVLVCGCSHPSRPPVFMRVVDHVAWQAGELKNCAPIRIKYADGTKEELVVSCGTEEEVAELVDMKNVGLLHPLTEAERVNIHKYPVLPISVDHPEKDLWKCQKLTDSVKCLGDSLPATAERNLPFGERRLSVWGRTREKTRLPGLGKLEAMCDDDIRGELEIAAYNRTHKATPKSQLTELRKIICGGPDGPEEVAPTRSTR